MALAVTAMYLKRPVVVTDVMTDPLWANYRHLAEICGLRAAGRPRSSHLKATFWVRSPCIARSSADQTLRKCWLTEVATHIAGIAIERQRVQEALRERDARINLAAESANLAFWAFIRSKQGLDE